MNMDRDMKSRSKSVKGHPTMGMHEKLSVNNSTDSRTPSSSEERNMKHGWFQIVNSTVHYFQSPFNVALIVQQLSNYNMLLRENIEMDKDCGAKQNNLLSDENGYGIKLNALAKECTPKMKNNTNDGDYSKTETDWIKPKKSITMTCFF